MIHVVTAVHNRYPITEKFVDSLLRQDCGPVHLILVDDGSLDESKCICKKMCSTDHRIRFISQEHKGVSAARNAALEIAAGEYLFFLDSDDAIHPCLLETMYSVLHKTNAAMAAVG